MVFCVGVGRGLFLLRSILRRERIVGRRGGELYTSPFLLDSERVLLKIWKKVGTTTSDGKAR